MPSKGGSQVCSPPELPPYLKNVYDLNSIMGDPTDDDVIGIHAVIRMAEKAIDIPGTGDAVVLAQLSEYLFDVQMGKSVKYQNRYLATVFPETTVYTPPTLPTFVAVQLEPIAGIPSAGDIIEVQSAIRSYDQFAQVPSMFDPRVDMELSQHLFDIQMARYTQRARELQPCSKPAKSPSSTTTKGAEPTQTGESDPSTNNAGSGAGISEPRGVTQSSPDINIQEILERSNRLAEQTNQFIERSNQIAERANQLVEQCGRQTEPSGLELFGGLVERLNQHLEESNRVAKESIQPVEKLGDALRNINKVLMRVQHAIVRGHKGNKLSALECLVNEKGETPAMSNTTLERTFENMATGDATSFSVVIDGATQATYFRGDWLGRFLHFYGIADGFCEDGSMDVMEGKTREARTKLRECLNSCLG